MFVFQAMCIFICIHRPAFGIRYWIANFLRAEASGAESWLLMVVIVTWFAQKGFPFDPPFVGDFFFF